MVKSRQKKKRFNRIKNKVQNAKYNTLQARSSGNSFISSDQTN